IVGVLMAAFRRILLRPKYLVYNSESKVILLAILAMLVTGFLIEGWRIAATDDPWGAWSPVGNFVASVSKPVMSQDALLVSHRVGWWTHLLLVFAFIAWAPFSKM